jgi:hypothetical protein
MHKKTLLTFSLFILLITACAPAGRSAVAPVEVEFADDAFFGGESVGAPFAESAESDLAIENFETGERIVIKNADLEIVVDAPDESMETIGRMAEQMGGFVVSANLYMTQLSDGQEVPRASITIRVPAENLDEAIAKIEAESDQLPLSKNINSQDVTSEYTDLQSRLRNLEAAEAQLMEIMASANKTEDVLNVFDQLTRVREQIEVIKGQIKYLDESARLSAVSVELIPNEVIQPITIGGWQPVGVIKDAIQSLIRALQGLVNVLIRLAFFILPLLLIIALPLYLIVRGVIKWRRRRGEARQDENNEPSPGPNNEE